VLALVLVASVLAVGTAPASAHTDSDVVAVAGGTQATVSFEPAHGCGSSPTVGVSIRVPVRGATPGEVPGWTATAVDDEDGAVLEWRGGVLPSDQPGRFPVTLPVPDEPGQLLLLPSIQTCEDGQELAWLDPSPTGQRPAPRLLILAPGSPPAATIDQVPANAPGRDQLIEIVDGDAADARGAGGTPPGSTAGPSTTTADRGEQAVVAPAPHEGSDEGWSTVLGFVVGAAVVLVVAAVVWVLLRRRSHRAG
jgi:uncharacterized protein YcnI